MVLVIIPKPTIHKIPSVATFKNKVMSQPIKKLTIIIDIEVSTADLKFLIYTPSMTLLASIKTIGVMMSCKMSSM